MAIGIGDLAAGATVAAGATTIATGIASALGDSGGGNSPRQLELPPALESANLDQYRQLLEDAQQTIEQNKAQIPYIEKRIQTMENAAQAGLPKADQIQAVNQVDAEIAQRFGKETAADIKAGIITDQAKNQVISLQKQITDSLQTNGQQVDDKLAIEIQQMIRNRISSGSQENQTLDAIGQQLVQEINRTGEVIPEKDPRVENQLKSQEDALRARLRAQFGSDYENTTQGQRALRDFYQGATETRFSVAQELKKAASDASVARVQRLATLGQTAGQLVASKDQGLLTNVEAAKGANDLSLGNIQRLSALGTAIQQQTDTALKAGEPARQQQLLDLQRAQVAQTSGQNLRTSYNNGLNTQAQILQLSTIPATLRQQILDARTKTLDAGAQLGQFKYSGYTQTALGDGNVPGFPGYSSVYNGTVDSVPVGGGLRVMRSYLPK